MHQLLTALFFLTSFIFSPAMAQGPVDEDGKRLQISLSAEAPIQAGNNATIAIQMHVLDGWHVYWLNAGDSGTPMMVDWDLPAGFQAGPQQWPTPEAIPYDPLVNYGYHGMPVVLQQLNVPDILPQGTESITVKGRFDVLICEDICIPETHDAQLTIPVQGTDHAAELVRDSSFAAYRAAMPREKDWTSQMYNNDGKLIMTVTADSDDAWDNWTKAHFFPVEWGLIHYAQAQDVTIDGNTITMRVTAADRPATQVGMSEWVIKNNTGESVLVNARAIIPDGITVAATTPTPTPNSTTGASGPSATTAQIIPEQLELSLVIPPLGLLLIFAFLGGLILNLMPCVFPVLSLKAVSIASHGAQRSVGLLYTMGVVLSFLVLAGVMLGLRASGQEIGWGFQLQNPLFVMALSWVFFMIGLSLFGAFDIGQSITGWGDRWTRGNGALSHIMTGVLAVIVATPCTAPFMAASIGAALTLPPIQVIGIFVALGLGLAAPILLISFIPALSSFLPKPGRWMVAFKQFMAFPIWATALWLVWVLARQSGVDALIPALGVMLLLALAVWARQIWVWVVMILIALGAMMMPLPALDRTPQADTIAIDAATVIEPFTSAYYAQVVADDRPLFVEMTADWCITCKVNKKIAIDRAETTQLFKDKNIRYLQGDWTHRDADITKYLRRYGRAGVPLYVYYPKGNTSGAGVVLPQILTPSIIAKTINQPDA